MPRPDGNLPSKSEVEEATECFFWGEGETAVVAEEEDTAVVAEEACIVL
jgi:hypothetical protein